MDEFLYVFLYFGESFSLYFELCFTTGKILLGVFVLHDAPPFLAPYMNGCADLAGTAIHFSGSSCDWAIDEKFLYDDGNALSMNWNRMYVSRAPLELHFKSSCTQSN